MLLLFFPSIVVPPLPPVPGAALYQTTTLQQAVNALAARLDDPSHVRFAQAELIDYLAESLRVWSAMTGSFRDVATFNTTAGEPFYDLATTNPALRGYHVTDRDLVRVIEYQLLEPPTPTAWTGSAQFSLSDLTQALQRRRDQFLLETGMVLTRVTQGLPPQPGGRQALPETVITVRRAAWRTTDGEVTPLHREDVWSLNHYFPAWVQSPGRPPSTVPFGFSVGETPPLQIQIAPPNSDTGTLDLITVSRGAVLDPTFPVLMGVPDDWAWVCRYGAMADLLSRDGLSADPLRAAYYEKRWTQGIEVAKTASVIWDARVLNMPVQVSSLTEADDYDLTWQGRSGSPDTVLLSEGTLFALSPVPPSNLFSVTMDIVRNAPVPATLTDYLQVGPELLDGLLDYAEHVAMSKEGIDAIQTTLPLFDRFMRLAGVNVGIDFASTPNLSTLTGQSQQDEVHTARMVTS